MPVQAMQEPFACVCVCVCVRTSVKVFYTTCVCMCACVCTHALQQAGTQVPDWQLSGKHTDKPPDLRERSRKLDGPSYIPSILATAQLQ